MTESYDLPLEIQEAIFEASSRGHLITVLTGRQHGSARPFIDKLEIKGLYSTNHGARVRDEAGTEIRRTLMDATYADVIVADYLDHEGLDFSCVMDDTLFVREPADERWDWVQATSRRLERYQAGASLEYDKVVFHSDEYARSEELDREIAEVHPQMLRYLWGDGFLEIVPAGADKGSALKFIAEQLGVPRSEVVAFGDGANDVSMVGWAGRGVAVGPHAHPQVRSAADEHIASPEEGGVAAWIRRNLL